MDIDTVTVPFVVIASWIFGPISSGTPSNGWAVLHDHTLCSRSARLLASPFDKGVGGRQEGGGGGRESSRSRIVRDASGTKL